MKILLSTICLLALTTSGMAQDNQLTYSSIKKNKEKKNASYKLKKGDLTIGAGLGSIGKWYGASANFSAEYMLNENVGLKATYLTNNILGGRAAWGGYSSYEVDLTYHFIQTKRWDVYAYAGLGINSFGFPISAGEITRVNSVVLNAGVGARYKVNQNLGVQLEVGTRSSLGLFKTFDLQKKRSIPLSGIAAD